VFWLAAILGSAGMLVAAAALGAALGSVQRVSSGTGHIEVAGLALSYPAFNGAGWLLVCLGGVGVATLTMAGRSAWHQRSSYRRFLERLEILGGLDGHPAVKVIADPRPEAFCAGFMRPTVFVSRGAFESLTPPELNAVLAHEYHHRLVHDPLRFAFGRILSQALFFLPALRPLCARYADLAEVNADRAAVRASAGRQGPLASALLVFDESAPPGASGISSARVDSLLGESRRWRLPRLHIAASIAALSVLGLLIWQASGEASVRATLNLPLLSSQPCVLMMLLPLLTGCLAVARKSRLMGPGSLGRDVGDR
jgi:Peptidase family M48